MLFKQFPVEKLFSDFFPVLRFSSDFFYDLLFLGPPPPNARFSTGSPNKEKIGFPMPSD